MGRPSYKITTKEDFYSAYLYLERNLDSYSLQIELKKAKEPEQLQFFCDEHLTPDEWKRLKATILAKRKRNKDSVPGKQSKNITLSPTAFREISKLQDNLEDYLGRKVSYSELIEGSFSHFNDMLNDDVIKFIELDDNN